MQRRKEIALGIVSLLLAVLGVAVAVQVDHVGTAYANIDFNLRYNELKAILRGCDPFLVWKGLLPSCGCTPFDFSLLPLWPKVQFIHAYPPWCYVPILPFGLIPYEMSLLLYRLMMGGMLAATLAVALWRIRLRSRQWGFVALSVLMMVLAARDGVCCCFIVGNMGVVVAFAVFFALLAHENKRDCLAGFFWALAMIKPQLSVLMILVLLLERKWSALTVVAITLSIFSLVVALLCGRNPLSMIMSIREYSVGMFHMTGLIPDIVWRPFGENVSESFLMSVNSILGVVLCIGAWWLGRHSNCVWVRFFPAVVLSLGWSAYRLHDFSLQIVPVFVAMMVFARARTMRQALASVTLCMLLGARLSVYADWLFPYVNWMTLLASFWLVLEARTLSFSKGGGDEDISGDSLL